MSEHFDNIMEAMKADDKLCNKRMRMNIDGAHTGRTVSPEIKKAAEKRRDMVLVQYRRGLKPSAIAARLRVGLNTIKSDLAILRMSGSIEASPKPPVGAQSRKD